MYRAYKVELNPNNKQITFFNKCFGTARWCYNWALDKRINHYKETQTTLCHNDVAKLLTQEKKTTKWLRDVPRSVHRNSMVNLDSAYQRFFKEHKGFPNFKSKHKSKKSFGLEQEQFKIYSDRIYIARLGDVRLKQNDYIPISDVKFISATVSERAGRYFVSVIVDVGYEQPYPIAEGDVVGIDLGIKTLATCSNGMVFENARALKTNLKSLKRMQRELHRRKKGSNNRNMTKKKISRKHYKISCIRQDRLHKMTTALVKTKPRVIVIEDLNVDGMMKNHKLAQAISDISFGEIRRQLDYKCKWRGIELFVIDRFFPSSKTCNACGYIKQDLKLSDRIYKCECGYEEDRDLNASYNIRDYYLNI